MTRSMRYRRALACACAIGLAGTALTSIGVAGATPPSRDTVTVAGTAAAGVRGDAPLGTVASSRPSTVQIWMKPAAGATAYATAVSTPGSARFHRYLSPAAYTARYGASATATAAVTSWLRAKGFTRVTTDPQRNYVRATGTVGASESAFAVRINRYRIRGASGAPETVTANDRDITLPAKIAKNVIGVTGLDNVAPQTFHAQNSLAAATSGTGKCSAYYGENVKTGLPTYHGSTSYPTNVCGYTGAQLRQAYGMDAKNTGAGQTVAYIEIGAPYKMEQTLQTWAADGGLPAPTPSNYSQLVIGSGTDCGNPYDIEEQLDIEAGYAMAPDAKQLLVGGDSCDEALNGAQSLFDAELAVIDGAGTSPLASIVSNSWGFPNGESIPSIYSTVLHSIMLRAAGEGVGMYFATGDYPGISVPADDPLVTAVGGTTLGLGKSGQRLFETGWSDDTLSVEGTGSGAHYEDQGIGRSAAGGGASLLWREPAYQKGVVPDSMTRPGGGDVSGLRAIPDISALADPFTGISEGVSSLNRHGVDDYKTFPNGGTSLATPLVAGMVAAAQQGRPSPFGFINPLLYGLSGTSALHDALPVTAATPTSQRAVYCHPSPGSLCFADSLEAFDGQDAQYTDQVTARGYDTMTGLGTPKGQAFVTALRHAGAS